MVKSLCLPLRPCLHKMNKPSELHFSILQLYRVTSVIIYGRIKCIPWECHQPQFPEKKFIDDKKVKFYFRLEMPNAESSHRPKAFLESLLDDDSFLPSDSLKPESSKTREPPEYLGSVTSLESVRDSSFVQLCLRL